MSLLKSGEQRYIKAVNNKNHTHTHTHTEEHTHTTYRGFGTPSASSTLIPRSKDSLFGKSLLTANKTPDRTAFTPPPPPQPPSPPTPAPTRRLEDAVDGQTGWKCKGKVRLLAMGKSIHWLHWPCQAELCQQTARENRLKSMTSTTA